MEDWRTVDSWPERQGLSRRPWDSWFRIVEVGAAGGSLSSVAYENLRYVIFIIVSL
jgi:hypothetical protein